MEIQTSKPFKGHHFRCPVVTPKIDLLDIEKEPAIFGRKLVAKYKIRSKSPDTTENLTK